MLRITPQMRILVAVEAVDFRKGIDSLAESDIPRKAGGLMSDRRVPGGNVSGGRNGTRLDTFVRIRIDSAS
jgi:hypothetical protein